MHAFPPHVEPSDGEQSTRLICPDCSGSITVRAKGENLLAFQCRVGHVYSLEEMLLGKELHVERAMWAAVHAYAELAAFLRDVGARNVSRPSVVDSERVRRLEQAEAHAEAVRRIIESDRRLTLAEPVNDGAAAP